jgi:hypothetical protein
MKTWQDLLKSTRSCRVAWASMGSHGSSWKPVESCGTCGSKKVCWHTGRRWSCVGSHGIPWKPVKLHKRAASKNTCTSTPRRPTDSNWHRLHKRPRYPSRTVCKTRAQANPEDLLMGPSMCLGVAKWVMASLPARQLTKSLR